MQTSGTPAAPITFISDTKYGAKLSCPTDNSFFTLAASYIVVSGFDMTCPGSTDLYLWAGGTYGNNGHNTFVNNYIHDMAVNGCVATGVLFSGTVGHNVFDSNVVRHGGTTTTADPQCPRSHGIYMTSPYDIAINNVVSGMVGYGIHSYGGGICHQTIANNTVFDNSQGGIVVKNTGSWGGYIDFCANGGKADFETITNNIAVDNGFGQSFSGGSYAGESGGILFSGFRVGTNNFISNNLVYGNNTYQARVLSPATAQKTFSGTNATVFVNYKSDKNWAPASSYNFQNYAERTGGPSIDAGIATGAPSYDVINATRPQGAGYDVGAYEQ